MHITVNLSICFNTKKNFDRITRLNCKIFRLFIKETISRASNLILFIPSLFNHVVCKSNTKSINIDYNLFRVELFNESLKLNYLTVKYFLFYCFTKNK
nr:MAG TPA: hypothetical protein [Caudoviricetes sp.]